LDDSIPLLIREIKVSNFQVIVFTKQDVLRLDIQVSDAIEVKVFKAINQLVEVGTGEFVVKGKVVILDKIKEVTKGSILHANVRGLHSLLVDDEIPLILVMVDTNNIVVGERAEAKLVCEMW